MVTADALALQPIPHALWLKSSAPGELLEENLRQNVHLATAHYVEQNLTGGALPAS